METINIIKTCDVTFDNDVKLAAKSFIINTLNEETKDGFNAELLHTALNIINGFHMKYTTEIIDENVAE